MIHSKHTAAVSDLVQSFDADQASHLLLLKNVEDLFRMVCDGHLLAVMICQAVD